MSPRRYLLVATAACLLMAHPLAATDDTPVILAQAGPAYIAEEPGGTAWTVGNAALHYRVGLNDAGMLVARALERPGQVDPEPVGESPDLSFLVQNERLSPGSAGLRYKSMAADGYRGGVRLRLVFEDPAARLRVTRAYVCYPTAPAIEAWAIIEVTGGAGVTIRDIGVWQLSVPVTHVNWVTGLKAAASQGGRFTRRRQALTAGGTFELGSTARSSELAVPTVWFEGPSAQFFGAMLWSGAWTLGVAGPEASGLASIRMTAGATSTVVQKGAPLETPHGIFGLAGPEGHEVAVALQDYVTGGLRQGRPVAPLVTQNTWYVYGNRIGEATIKAEMASAAALGVELFVVDAGWWAGGTAVSDYTTGLGTWTADTRRFPSGLRALRDHAHALGLKFGIWVEPERVATATVGKSGLARERFLATAGGRYNAGVKNDHADAALVCLADTEARQWVLAQLVRFIDEVQPDYVKWDNNYWINCDRTSHGHGTLDGNFMHTRGLYEVLGTLRARYPDLVVENCAAGGNRLDLGMLQFTDAAWMDDVSAPSAHVRHNLEGLGAVFPPAYLLSFVMDDPAERIHGADDLPMYFRSRMAGALGLSLVPAQFSDEEREVMREQIALYKDARAAAPDMTFVLLTDQANAAGGGGWDAAQWYSPGTGAAVVFAFAGPAAESRVTVWPRLRADARYSVVVPRRGAVGQATGAALMQDGLTIPRLSFTAGYVLQLTQTAATQR